jgi:hypothetical protein
MAQEEQPDLELKHLSSYYCTDQYFTEPLFKGIKWTDGVNYIMKNGYSWFVTDALSVIVCTPLIRREEFLVIKLTRAGDNEADLTIDDGNDHQLYDQHYDLTDAKRDLRLYLRDSVLMLPSEY